MKYQSRIENKIIYFRIDQIKAFIFKALHNKNNLISVVILEQNLPLDSNKNGITSPADDTQLEK